MSRTKLAIGNSQSCGEPPPSFVNNSNKLTTNRCGETVGLMDKLAFVVKMKTCFFAPLGFWGCVEIFSDWAKYALQKHRRAHPNKLLSFSFSCYSRSFFIQSIQAIRCIIWYTRLICCRCIASRAVPRQRRSFCPHKDWTHPTFEGWLKVARWRWSTIHIGSEMAKALLRNGKDR